MDATDKKSEDDGVAPLFPFENLARNIIEYEYTPPSPRLAVRISFDDEENGRASTSTVASDGGAATPLGSGSPTSSDPSTPPSANRPVVFSPMRSREYMRLPVFWYVF